LTFGDYASGYLNLLLVGTAKARRVGYVDHGNNIFHIVNAVGDASANGWRYAKRLVNAAEVVPKEIERQRVAMILEFLGKGVCQPSEAPHRHAHGEVLPLGKRRVDVAAIRIALDDLMSIGVQI
jgi:hypothetical protein